MLSWDPNCTNTGKINSKLGSHLNLWSQCLISSINGSFGHYLTIITQAQMGSESIVHEAKGQIGY